MDTTVKILQLTPERWEEYKTLRLESMQQDPQAFGDKFKEWSEYSDEKWQKRPKDPDKIILMAEDNNKFVGIIAVHIDHLNENEHEAHIWGMYITPVFRGKGISKMLMNELIEKLKSIDGLHRIELMVSAEQEAAIKSYLSSGFNKIGETDWVLGDNQNHKLHIMEKTL